MVADVPLGFHAQIPDFRMQLTHFCQELSFAAADFHMDRPVSQQLGPIAPVFFQMIFQQFFSRIVFQGPGNPRFLS